ncbi:triose-phosphate isomerase [Caulobacter sp. RL271]|uniref:Triosephosphate isomerase n=2 Tax=Caulobacter TaxID=75 RepID=A0ABY5A0Z5_9CAUL|nr:triose-phosphate isomerase [Caulobacter segnis]
MNGGLGLLGGLAAALKGGGWTGRAVVCPPATLLGEAHRLLGPLGVEVGGQDCHVAERGAHTGDLSAALLAAAGARHVIVGHSERRAAYGEADAWVRDKAVAAVEAGLSPIVCVGDTAEMRAAGLAVETVTRQARAVLDARLAGRAWALAYEPVWAIGSGRAASRDEIIEMHAALRTVVGRGTLILYGGSVTPGNAGEILACPEVDGLLIGGASLRPDQFAAILRT